MLENVTRRAVSEDSRPINPQCNFLNVEIGRWLCCETIFLTDDSPSAYASTRMVYLFRWMTALLFFLYVLISIKPQSVKSVPGSDFTVYVSRGCLIVENKFGSLPALRSSVPSRFFSCMSFVYMYSLMGELVLRSGFPPTTFL